ncbi:putative thiazole-containing bacteriocin maturation protein [Bacillus sp. FJAT-26390]|uniref:putative thiazole-containing bacteriocin maturation protein n=1 Tax=Bacillus sp. FJAT-26390 TaxID=1743142 RepID=UPI00080805D6|nr:putative thiazole-containing bacteriocin maturation protein [Bacillus sp. FJAT-26390]
MDPSMRLKVRGDTFFLPSSDGSVYFRNNIGSFRMEGSTIDQWIEKLMPVFNGEHSMFELTEGLPEQYQKHVYEIAETLYANGYVRDVSKDVPHQLQESVLKKYASQIEFLDSFEGSGAYRFQRFRQSSVLAVGSGPFLVSLIRSLLESGLTQIQMLDTNPESTNRERISELAEHARQVDGDVKLDEIVWQKDREIDWQSVVQPFDAVLLVSGEGGMPRLKALQAICKAENKVLLPAVILKQAGIAGPLIQPDSDVDFESAWRRLHQHAVEKESRHHVVSATAEAMLANVIVFEWLKTATEVAASALKNKLFLLNLETLEGGWHAFLPHPLAGSRPAGERIENLNLLLERKTEEKLPTGLITYFSGLTSSETGILHEWEEGELRQLPLSQCRAQAVDPLSAGPAEVLPAIIRNGINHEEARREAGLAGIEAYLSRMTDVLLNTEREGSGDLDGSRPNEFVGVGAGETIAEGIGRALQTCLTAELEKMFEASEPSVHLTNVSQVDDERSRYYINALTTMQGAPAIGFGEALSGFPVVWVGTRDRWYGAVDFNRTRALRRSLQQALLDIQNQAAFETENAIRKSSVSVIGASIEDFSVPASDTVAHREILQAALALLQKNRKRIVVYDLTVETFLKEELAGAFGVSLREEDER